MMQVFFALSESACLQIYLSQITVPWAQNAVKSVLKMAKLAPSEKRLNKGGA